MPSTPDIAIARLPHDTLADNFSDLHPALDRFQARVAAERCLFCYDAPCVTACPTAIDIPLFIRQIATGNPLGAARTILDSNIMGGMCARVCPTETLCEQACVRNVGEDNPVEIGRLQRYATDTVFASGTQFYRQGPATGATVAVVGAGPAGLACAHKLATLGHAVTVFEARDKAGGLNEYGIAAYKATDAIAAREVAYILEVGGITVECGQRLGRDLTLPDLTDRFDAVFLGIGLSGVNALGIADELPGVEDAVAYIARLRQADDLCTLPVGRRVVVVGGGMTAIDIASQAKRLGAEDVTIVYRRSQDRMNASDYEQQVAQTDGVLIRTCLRPVRLIAADGQLAAVELEYTREEDGRLVGTGETLTLPCDQLFKAIGQTLAESELAGLIATRSGRIVVDAERRTSLPGVWAGGDCVLGGQDLTVAAVEDGKRAAQSIDAALRARRAQAA